MSTRTNKIASALLLLKKDPLMKLKLIGYWVATAFFALQILVVAITELKGSNQILQIRIHEPGMEIFGPATARRGMQIPPAEWWDLHKGNTNHVEKTVCHPGLLRRCDGIDPGCL